MPETVWSRFKEITSAANPAYKRLKKLMSSRRARQEGRAALLEGCHLVAACLESGRMPDFLVISDTGRKDAEVVALLQKMPDVPGMLLTDTLFQGLSSVESPQGMLATLPIPHLESSPADSCILLDDIQDPGNVGTILRTAAAAGIQQVYLSRGCADVWSPKVLRAGMGAHFLMALHEGADLLATARDFPGSVLMTSLQARQSLFEIDLRGNCAFIFGNEGAGVSAPLQAVATQQVLIPMPGAMESLNVATAAAICLFERVRQLGA